jgi:type I restriction enzyme S subunit
MLNPPKDLEKMENQGWVTKKVAWLFKTGSGTTPTSDKSEYFEGSIPWVNSGDLNDSIINASKTCVSEAALKDFSPLRMYPEGSLLVAMYGATVGKTGILGIEACVNQAVCVLHTESELSTSFAHFWFISNRNNLIEQSVGGGQPNINQEIIRSQRISFPSSEDQQRIVGEMQEITNQRKFRSELVEKSIGLLVEYKDSLITSSVTGYFDAAIGKRSAK